MNLTPRVLGVAMGADLAIFVPVLLVYLAAGRAAGVAAVGGGIVAPAFGGFVAGRLPSSSPLTHGAVATAAVALGYVVVRLVDAVVRNKPVHPASVVFLVIVSATAGTAGAWLGFRARATSESA